jgi:nuclear pore complex protein Nup133
MFSPEASVQSARSSLRNSNPKRRQRISDGLQQQQPRRKRSKLSSETFADKEEPYVNGNGSALMNGHAGHGSAEKSLAVVAMPVREKKAPPKRAVKEDTTTYLVRQSPRSPTSTQLTTIPT